jgi:hypothetical protein
LINGTASFSALKTSSTSSTSEAIQFYANDYTSASSFGAYDTFYVQVRNLATAAFAIVLNVTTNSFTNTWTVPSSSTPIPPSGSGNATVSGNLDVNQYSYFVYTATVVYPLTFTLTSLYGNANLFVSTVAPVGATWTEQLSSSLTTQVDSIVLPNATVGTNYYVKVASLTASSFTLRVSYAIPSASPSVGVSQTPVPTPNGNSVNPSYGTLDTVRVTHFVNGTGPASRVWYIVNSGATGLFNIALTKLSGDVILSLFQGNGVPNWPIGPAVNPLLRVTSAGATLLLRVNTSLPGYEGPMQNYFVCVQGNGVGNGSGPGPASPLISTYVLQKTIVQASIVPSPLPVIITNVFAGTPISATVEPGMNTYFRFTAQQARTFYITLTATNSSIVSLLVGTVVPSSAVSYSNVIAQSALSSPVNSLTISSTTPGYLGQNGVYYLGVVGILGATMGNGGISLGIALPSMFQLSVTYDLVNPSSSPSTSPGTIVTPSNPIIEIPGISQPLAGILQPLGATFYSYVISRPEPFTISVQGLGNSVIDLSASNLAPTCINNNYVNVGPNDCVITRPYQASMVGGVAQLTIMPTSAYYPGVGKKIYVEVRNHDNVGATFGSLRVDYGTQVLNTDLTPQQLATVVAPSVIIPVVVFSVIGIVVAMIARKRYLAKMNPTIVFSSKVTSNPLDGIEANIGADASVMAIPAGGKAIQIKRTSMNPLKA